MLEIEDIKVADLNKGEEPLPNGKSAVYPPRYGDYISLINELRWINKELHEVNKSLKLIAGSIR